MGEHVPLYASLDAHQFVHVVGDLPLAGSRIVTYTVTMNHTVSTTTKNEFTTSSGDTVTLTTQSNGESSLEVVSRSSGDQRDHSYGIVYLNSEDVLALWGMFSGAVPPSKGQAG